ncbi:MAG: glycosyltransferase family 9 protein, partial [Candidatus Babeliales bacterium]
LFLTPCPSWKRECLASLVTLSNKKTLNIHSDKRYSILLPSQNINVSDPFTHDIENTTESLKQYDLTLENINIAKKAIKKKYLNPALQNEKYVIFHPTASSEYKFYSKEFWIDLASKFSQLGYGVYIVSGPVKKEQDFCLQILEKIPTATYLKNAEFSKLCRLIRNANYFIGLDSSIMHLAATLDCQLVALWSFANFRRIYPYGMNAKIYLPEEVLKAKEFKYPKKELKELKRANAQDIIQIIQNDMKSSLQLVSKLVGPIHCYKF